MRRFLPGCLMAVLLTVGAEAATYQVPADFPTLLEAADVAVNGDSILVAPGVYTRRETRGTIRASAFVEPGVTILGTGGAASTIVAGDTPEPDVSNAVIHVLTGSASPIEIIGLSIRGGEAGLTGVQPEVTASGVETIRLVDCVLEDCSTAVGGWTIVEGGRYELERCVFRNNTAPGGFRFIVETDVGELRIRNCVFEDNVGPLVGIGRRSIGAAGLSVIGSVFRRNEQGPMIRVEDVTGVVVRNCRFEDNVSNSGSEGICLAFGESAAGVTGNVFVGNRHLDNGYVNRFVLGRVTFEGNTLYANEVPPGRQVIGVFTDGPSSLRANVVAGTLGGAAVTFSSGCNVFWDNAGGTGIGDLALDMELDPEFCDPASGSFTVRASSPCLIGNGPVGCVQIGAFGEGCPGSGLVPTWISSDPAGRTLILDGQEVLSPELVVWEPGTVHSLSVPEIQMEGGARWTFDSWSDGGAATHDVVAPDSYGQLSFHMSEEFLLEVGASGPGTTTPNGTMWVPAGGPVTIEAIPDHGYRFTEWDGSGNGSYRGDENPVPLLVNGPIWQQAHFELGEFELRTSVASGEGRIVPAGGSFEAFSDLVLRARPERGFRFVEWRGSGDGSYTGRANPITVTFDEPITQVARFEPVRFDLALSLSGSNPNVHEGVPLEFGEVHLFATCAGGRRIQEVELVVGGTMDVLTFVPAPGMVSQGMNPVVVNTGTCRWASVRLGHFLVLDPEGGTLCVNASSGGSPLVVTDCSGARIPWPEQVSIVGVNTAGGAPCSTGTGCNNQIETGPEAVGGSDIALAAPMRIGLNEVFPNPFTGETTIRYAVSRPQPVRIAVYDVTGRRVRVLRNAPVDPGVSSMVWDGRDFAGARVASGVYFVRLRSDEVTEARKVVRIGGGR